MIISFLNQTIDCIMRLLCIEHPTSETSVKVVNEDGDAFEGFFACLLDVHGELDLCLYGSAQVDDAVEGGGE